jgi:hypothetical protein
MVVSLYDCWSTKDITKTRQYRNFGMANQKDIESIALDENGREVWYSCSDL